MNFEEKKSIYKGQLDIIAQNILSQMESASDENWIMPWHKGSLRSTNAITGKPYTGNNNILLWNLCETRMYSSNRWATFYQWRKLKSKIKKGEKGTLICIAIPRHRVGNVQPIFINSETDINQNNLYFIFKFIHVFNCDQVKGYTPDYPDLFNPNPDYEVMLQQLINKSKANITNTGVSAFYNYVEDYIEIPLISRFIGNEGSSGKEEYYSTLVHELIHWTGHESRCNRVFGKENGSPEYAFEELVAELGSTLLTTAFQQKIVPPKNHSLYLKFWLKVLKNDFSFLTDALELARYSMFWLFEKTDIHPFDFSLQYKRVVNEERVKAWNELIN